MDAGQASQAADPSCERRADNVGELHATFGNNTNSNNTNNSNNNNNNNWANNLKPSIHPPEKESCPESEILSSFLFKFDI